MKKFREINFSWDKIGSWQRCDPYTIVFFYPINSSPIVLKGSNKKVERWIDRFIYPAFYRYTYWHHGQSRGGWRFLNCEFNLRDWPRENIKEYGRPYVITHKGRVVAKLRKVPNAFPKSVKEILDARN